jgi:hypothetical protein
MCHYWPRRVYPGLQPRHPLQSGVGSDPVKAEQEPWLKDGSIQRLVGGRALQSLGEVQPQVGFLDHVEQARHGPGRGDLCLERGQVGRLGLSVERRRGDPTVALLANPDQTVGRQSGIKGVERLAHFGLEIGDEAIGFERQAQLLIIGRSSRLEVDRQIIVRVPVTIGADDPDFLASKFVAKRLQHADLISDPVDAGPSLRVLLDDRLPPKTAGDAVDRHGLLDGKGVQLAVGVTLQKIEGLNDRTMVHIVGAEIQSSEDLRHHAAIMAFVRVPDHRAQSGPIGRPRGLPFLDQVAQGLFADDRKHDFPHDPVGAVDGGARDLEQKVLLARHAFQVVEQLAVHPAFGTRADMVDGLDQEIDQAIRQLALAKMHKGREPGEPSRFGVSAQLIGSLDLDAPPIPFQFVGKHLVEQIRGQPDAADQIQLGQLGLNAGEAGPPRIAP